MKKHRKPRVLLLYTQHLISGFYIMEL